MWPFSRNPYATPKKKPRYEKAKFYPISNLPGGLEFSKRSVNRHAVGITAHLQKNGHETYLVGGCVRDLLIGMNPKDFDIGTMAWPRTIKRLVKHSRIIGRRFRLVHVPREGQIFEVATFRREADDKDKDEGKKYGENFFGNAAQDAWRRDFTVNAIFFDPVEERFVDYVGGIKDIQKRTIRCIGNPKERFAEDPVRMLRAIRFSSFPGFKMAPGLRKSIQRNADYLNQASRPRIREELLKFMKNDQALANFKKAQELEILPLVVPELEKAADFTNENDLSTKLYKAIYELGHHPLPIFGFGMMVYLVAPQFLGGERGDLFTFQDYKDNNQLHKFCMEILFLSNAERESIFYMLDMAKKMIETDSQVYDSNKKQKKLFFHSDFPFAFHFMKCLNHAQGELSERLSYWEEMAEKYGKKGVLEIPKEDRGPWVAKNKKKSSRPRRGNYRGKRPDNRRTAGGRKPSSSKRNPSRDPGNE